MTKVLRMFLYSAGLVFALSGAAKLISASGGARVLDSLDPILGVPFRAVFLVVGGTEFLAALVCFFARGVPLRVWLVACLATDFVLYRLGVWLVGWVGPCRCLGSLTDALHISPRAADAAMKALLAYLLVGSYAALYFLWRGGVRRPFERQSSLLSQRPRVNLPWPSSPS